MKLSANFFLMLGFALLMTSCVSNKKYTTLQQDFDRAKQEHSQTVDNYTRKLATCNDEKESAKVELSKTKSTLDIREEQIDDLKNQIADYKTQRDKQLEQVGDLTVLSQSANQNIKETLSQLEKRDKYIRLLQAAKSKADSINLALAVNLKSVLKNGIEDEDVEIKVDKTVVFINLSDKMLYESGSYNLTPRASEVLNKIAQIVKSRPELDVMVEGYTDNVPMENDCITDNWDLSVKRSTSVVRTLQKNFGVDPNRLIAAGRGEYNALAGNDTPEGRSTNRRTRIIILPRLNQFYDLLNPTNMPKG